jgi:ElaB/YqjD/DUF883 family membrane-anchored ribosome-binding protein
MSEGVESLATAGAKAKAASKKIDVQVDQAIDSLQQTVVDFTDQAKVVTAKLADQAKAVSMKVTEQSRDAFDRASGGARTVVETVDPMVKEQPYVAIAVAAAAGLLIGLLMAARAPKVIYLKARN